MSKVIKRAYMLPVLAKKLEDQAKSLGCSESSYMVEAVREKLEKDKRGNNE